MGKILETISNNWLEISIVLVIFAGAIRYVVKGGTIGISKDKGATFSSQEVVKEINENINNNTSETINALSKLSLEMKEVKQSVLRLTLHNKSIPITERLAAGDKYLAAGGNGASKIFYQALQTDYALELDALKRKNTGTQPEINKE